MYRLLNSHWPLGIVAVGALVLFISYVWNPIKAVEHQIDADPPGIPEELADHQERAGLERGRSVGATPSKALPRPDNIGLNYVFKGSPNWSSRGTCGVEAIVVHVTGPGSMAGMASWFNNPSSQVSAHFGIGKQGEVHQYVELGDAAWHAGILNRPNLSNPVIANWVASGVNPNRCHVGIELLLGGPAEPLVEYPAMQASLDKILLWLRDVSGVPLDRVHVIGHYEIDGVNRSTDPRCCVDIDRVLTGLAPAPVSVWGACDTSWSPGGCWHLVHELWVSSIGIFDPVRPDLGWQAPPLP
jgi:N-acetyl-anhydromuramyl-L-alanine amidase AmpD